MIPLFREWIQGYHVCIAHPIINREPPGSTIFFETTSFFIKVQLSQSTCGEKPGLLNSACAKASLNPMQKIMDHLVRLIF